MQDANNALDWGEGESLTVFFRINPCSTCIATCGLSGTHHHASVTLCLYLPHARSKAKAVGRDLSKAERWRHTQNHQRFGIAAK